MILAVASGKGGTGKTTLSVALSLALEKPVQLLDCDVEEPNSHLFLQPESKASKRVSIKVPEVNIDLCNGCGRCSEVCEFNSIVVLKGNAVAFNEMCHSCGGCTMVCSQKAIKEVDFEIGEINWAIKENVHFCEGVLDIGNAMAPPLIRQVKEAGQKDMDIIIDCPPGTSCPMITAVQDADYVILVTEPTPFGLHDLVLAVETVRLLGMPFGVVINRCDSGDNRVVEYCEKEGIDIILQIQDDYRVAQAYSRAQTLLDALPQMKGQCEDLYGRIQEIVCGGVK